MNSLLVLRLDHPVVKALPVEVPRQGFERFQVLVDIEIAPFQLEPDPVLEQVGLLLPGHQRLGFEGGERQHMQVGGAGQQSFQHRGHFVGELLAYLGIGIPPQPGLLALVFQGQDLQIPLRRSQGLPILAQPGVGVIQPAIDAHGPEQHDPGQQNEDPLAQAEGCDLLRPSLPLCLHVHQGVSRAMPLSWKASWPSLSRLRVSSPNCLPAREGVCLKRFTQAGTS